MSPLLRYIRTAGSTGNMRGFSTLEILLAMSIVIVSMCSIALLVFGEEDSVIHDDQAARAQSLLEDTLTQEGHLATQDFDLLVDATSTQGTYTIAVSAPLQADYLTKNVTIRVSWADPYHNSHHVETSTLMTNYTAEDGGNTCDSTLRGNWQQPLVHTYATIPNTSLSGIDVYHGKAYVTGDTTNNKTDSTFFVYDTARDDDLTASFDDATSTKYGLTAVYATDHMIYALSVHSPDLWMVHPHTYATSTYRMEGVASDTGGKSLIYKDNLLYAGLEKTEGGELHVIDVHDVSHPEETLHRDFGTSVNALKMYASSLLVAVSDTPSQQRFFILDPTNLSTQDSFSEGDAMGGNGGYGKSFATFGHWLFFGRTSSSNLYSDTWPELYSFDPVSQGLAPQASVLLGPTVGVNAILVRYPLVFLLTSKSELQMYTISGPTSLNLYATTSIPGNGVAMDCEGNTLYVVSNKDGNGYISQITAQPI